MVPTKPRKIKGLSSVKIPYSWLMFYLSIMLRWGFGYMYNSIRVIKGIHKLIGKTKTVLWSLHCKNQTPRNASFKKKWDNQPVTGMNAGHLYSAL